MSYIFCSKALFREVLAGSKAPVSVKIWNSEIEFFCLPRKGKDGDFHIFPDILIAEYAYIHSRLPAPVMLTIYDYLTLHCVLKAIWEAWPIRDDDAQAVYREAILSILDPDYRWWVESELEALKE